MSTLDPDALLASIRDAEPASLPQLGALLEHAKLELLLRLQRVGPQHDVGGQARPALLDAAALAARLSIAESYARRLIDQGAFPVVEIAPKCVRVDANDVDAYVTRQKQRRGQGLSRAT